MFYDRILVPLDGSPLAEAAIPFVELIPSRLVYLIRVEPSRSIPYPPATPPLDGYLERIGDTFRRQGREVEILGSFGDPAERIIEAAADVDLIVMTTRGHGGAGRALLGSVADRVAWRAPAPTLLVRGGDRPVAGPPITRLIVPLDGSPLAEDVLPVASNLASDLGVRVHLVRVVNPSRSDERSRHIEQEAGAYLDDRARQLRNADLTVSRAVRRGSPADELMSVLMPGDLVVMATQGRGGLRRWLLGSVAEVLVREAEVPVLLVRAGTTPAGSTGTPDPDSVTKL